MVATWALRSTWLASLASVISGSSAQLSIATDFCSLDGGICEVSRGQGRLCGRKGGADYYECVCLSGFVPLEAKCNQCLHVLDEGWPVSDQTEFWESVCSDEGHTIAPIPSSVISQQEERNKTVSFPDQLTTTESVGASSRTDVSTSVSIAVYTKTLDAAGPSEPLPQPAAATETGGVASSWLGEVTWIWVWIGVCCGVFAI